MPAKLILAVVVPLQFICKSLPLPALHFGLDVKEFRRALCKVVVEGFRCACDVGTQKHKNRTPLGSEVPGARAGGPDLP